MTDRMAPPGAASGSDAAQAPSRRAEAAALVEATLALVEQQRLANLIAWVNGAVACGHIVAPEKRDEIEALLWPEG